MTYIHTVQSSTKKNPSLGVVCKSTQKLERSAKKQQTQVKNYGGGATPKSVRGASCPRPLQISEHTNYQSGPAHISIYIERKKNNLGIKSCKSSYENLWIELKDMRDCGRHRTKIVSLS